MRDVKLVVGFLTVIVGVVAIPLLAYVALMSALVR